MSESEAINAATNATQNTPFYDRAMAGAKAAFDSPDTIKALGGYKTLAAAALPGVLSAAKQKQMPTTAGDNPQMIRPYSFDYNPQTPTNPISAQYTPHEDTSERLFFKPKYTALTPYKAADGGIISLAVGGMSNEHMLAEGSFDDNTTYPQAYTNTHRFAVPTQTPVPENILANGAPSVDPNTGKMRHMSTGGRTDGGGPSTGTAGPAADASGQGVSSLAQSVALGMMGLASVAPGLATGIASAIGNSIADSQMAAMGLAQSVASEGQEGGHTVTSDANGNTSVSPGMSSNGMGVSTDGSDGVGVSSSSDSSSSSSDGSSSSGDGAGSAGAGEARGGLSPNFPQHMAVGGLPELHYNLGGYSDGGRLLRGPGDGVSDSIPAQIGNHQPARLADGEFVVPARIVSELGNGSTEAGARQLYKMLDRVQQARAKTTGKSRVAKNTNAAKYLPA